jgi:hypothetical protein
MKDKEKQIFEFKVIDKKTGKEADIGEIALKEDWAKSLMYCDMQGFAITEDNHLILLDECGKYEFCPSDRFEIIPEDSVVLNGSKLTKLVEQTSKETAEKILNEIYKVLWDEKTPIASSFINLDVKIREIATREGIEIKE